MPFSVSSSVSCTVGGRLFFGLYFLAEKQTENQKAQINCKISEAVRPGRRMVEVKKALKSVYYYTILTGIYVIDNYWVVALNTI